jgi:hypothetical protein
MLLNEFLKEHRSVQELEKRIQALAATGGKMRDQRRHLPQGTPGDF